MIVGVVVVPSKPYGIHNERSQLIEVLVLIACLFFRIFSPALYHAFAKTKAKTLPWARLTDRTHAT